MARRTSATSSSLVSDPISPHAGAGGARSRAISELDAPNVARRHRQPAVAREVGAAQFEETDRIVLEGVDPERDDEGKRHHHKLGDVGAHQGDVFGSVGKGSEQIHAYTSC